MHANLISDVKCNKPGREHKIQLMSQKFVTLTRAVEDEFLSAKQTCGHKSNSAIHDIMSEAMVC